MATLCSRCNIPAAPLAEGRLPAVRECSSNAVTVVHTPPTLPDLVEQIEQHYGFILARGQEQYRDRLFRIGHCGWYYRRDLIELADALEELLKSR